jgi:hypothetical protein
MKKLILFLTIALVAFNVNAQLTGPGGKGGGINYTALFPGYYQSDPLFIENNVDVGRRNQEAYH